MTREIRVLSQHLPDDDHFGIVRRGIDPDQGYDMEVLP